MSAVVAKSSKRANKSKTAAVAVSQVEPTLDTPVMELTAAAPVATPPASAKKPRSRSKEPATTAAKKSPRTAARSKSPKTDAVKTETPTPVKSEPASKPRSKSVGPSSAKQVAGKSSSAKSSSQPSGKPTGKVDDKQRRPVNTKPAPINFTGIGIGSAKVKKVLMQHAFNRLEYLVCQELIKAEAKPIKPKPSKENPDPEPVAQHAPVPVDQLPKEFLDVIRSAEAAHELSLYNEYEHSVVQQMTPADKEAYQAERKKAMDANDFNLRVFNQTFNKKFYDGFAAWCKANDSYALGRVVKDKKGVERARFNQWSRVMALVNKLRIRLSTGVRDILACWLDNIVVQYATNGIHNCVSEQHSNLQLEHALKVSDGFSQRVSMDSFVRTLGGYTDALKWIESRRQVKESNRELRKKLKKEQESVTAVVEQTKPEYPKYNYAETFDGYVVDICRSVRMNMAEAQKTAADKAKYYNIKVSENFKKFCSAVIFEAIMRVGAHLKEVVELKDVKTVNGEIMRHTLKQVSNVCGVPFEPISADLDARVAKFRNWCATRRTARRVKRAEPDADAVDEDEEVAVDEEDTAEEVAVEYETN